MAIASPVGEIISTIENAPDPKFIVLRFPDICRACAKKMNPGNPAAWFGKKGGVKHMSCYLSKKELVVEKIDW